MALLPAPLSSPSSSSSSSPSSALKPFCCFSSKRPFFVGFSLAFSKPKSTARTAVASFPVITKRSRFVVRAQQEEEEEEQAQEQQQQQQSQPQPEERKKKDRKKHLSLVPLDQRWLFEEPELDGPDIWNNTWYPKAADHVNTDKTWYVVDATDKILGRLASTIAVHIRGKNLATYTPSVDMGAFVIVVNAEKIAVSGKKRTQKLYRRHSGRPGGMKVETFDQLQQRIPERIIEHAVRGMLPKGRLGRALFNQLKVYKGPSHPHEAQKPIPLPIRDKRVQKQT